MAKKRSLDSYVRTVQQRLDDLDDRETALIYNNRNKGAMQVLAKGPQSTPKNFLRVAEK
jgi:hypothetical protein